MEQIVILYGKIVNIGAINPFRIVVQGLYPGLLHVPLFVICPPWFFVPPWGHKCPPFWHLINKVLLSIKVWTSSTDIVDIYCKTASSPDTDQSPKRGKILLPRLASLRPALTSPRLASCQHFKSLPRLASPRGMFASLRLASENSKDHDWVPIFRV